MTDRFWAVNGSRALVDNAAAGAVAAPGLQGMLPVPRTQADSCCEASLHAALSMLPVLGLLWHTHCL